MKINLKTVGVAVAGIALLAIIGGETYYIINSKKDLKSITSETVALKNNLSQVTGNLREKEEKLNKIQEIVTERSSEKKAEEKPQTSEKEPNTNSSDSKKKKSEVVGKYSDKTQYTTMAEDRILYSDLELGEDGTYSYGQFIHAEQGEYGNWYIDNNGDIILNRLFVHSSDTALRMSKNSEVKKLTINSDGSLTDSNKKFEGGALNDLSKIVLKKESSSSNFKLFDKIEQYRESSLKEGYKQLQVFGE